jgi:hypothetical protein
VLVTHNSHAFDLFPSCSPGDDGGNGAYWKDVPSLLVNAVVDGRLSVWPLLGGGPPTHVPLSDSVLIVPPDEDGAHILALRSKELHVEMCQIPSHVKDVLDKGKIVTVSLSPHVVYERLQACWCLLFIALC